MSFQDLEHAGLTITGIDNILANTTPLPLQQNIQLSEDLYVQLHEYIYVNTSTIQKQQLENYISYYTHPIQLFGQTIYTKKLKHSTKK